MTLLTNLGYYPERVDSVYAPLSFDPKQVSVVIPVKNNQDGIDRFVTQLIAQDKGTLPKEVIIVDNQSDTPVEINEQSYTNLEIRVITCDQPGPAAARNKGVSHAQGQWILFTDSDCIPTPSFLTGYQAAMNGSIGYAGDVQSSTDTPLTRYYDSQKILVPPKCIEDDVERPEYLVTANVLVWKPAFDRIGGFNEEFTFAGGEDIDLAFRLRTIGDLSYAPGSLVHHHFDDGISGFIERFFRYGKGNRIVAEKFGLDLYPRQFQPQIRTAINLIFSAIQYTSLVAGYNAKK